MRLAGLVVVLAVGCGSRTDPPRKDELPARPDREQFRKLDAEARCEAVTPRAMRCADELLVMALDELEGSRELRDEVARNVERRPRAAPDEAREIAMTTCLGDRGFADDVYICWDRETCKELVACIAARSATGSDRRGGGP